MLKEIIPLSKPNINERDISAVVKVLESGMLVQGKEVEELELLFSNYFNNLASSLVSNGTSSLHLALIALGIGPGDEVIIPALSYVATANVVELVGATCVFVDTHPRYFNIDENKIESKITPKTKAIIPVHEFGLCANMIQIIEIAKKHNLFVIEDAACALGATLNGQLAGTFGDFGSFSFHPRKAITSGEGGLLITSNLKNDKIIKTLRNHGIENGSNPMNFVSAGFNYRMTDIQAALLKSQFKRFSEIIQFKEKLANIYLEEVKNPAIKLPQLPENTVHSWQTFHILLESEKERDRLREYLQLNGVLTNYGAQCIPFMEYYKNKYGIDSLTFYPNAYTAYTCGLAIPLYEKLNEKQIKDISKLLNNFK